MGYRELSFLVFIGGFVLFCVVIGIRNFIQDTLCSSTSSQVPDRPVVRESLPVPVVRQCAARPKKQSFYSGMLHELESKHKRNVPVQWRQCKHKNLPKPSVAEEMIIDQLVRYSVRWTREVEFLDHKSSEYGHYRYDFYLPDYNTVIEYDGKGHAQVNRKKADKSKDEFCASRGIKMIRYNKSHFYRIPEVMEELMKSLHIPKN